MFILTRQIRSWKKFIKLIFIIYFTSSIQLYLSKLSIEYEESNIYIYIYIYIERERERDIYIFFVYDLILLDILDEIWWKISEFDEFF